MRLLEPRRRFQGLSPGPNQAVDVSAKGGIGQQARDLVARDRLQDCPWVVGKLP
jgi:hypothetical protein